MKDAANLLSATKTVCRSGRGLPAKERGTVAKKRWWRDVASGLERLRAIGLLVIQGALDGRVEASGPKRGLGARAERQRSGVKSELHARVDRRRAVLLKPGVQFLYFARRERSDGAFNFLDGV